MNQYSYLQQKIEISMSGLYTIVTNINGNIYTFQFDTSNSSIIQKYSGFNILVSYDGQYLRFTFMFTEKGTSINIYYARIDKGNIAYAHVPEDYAIALARCQTRLYGIVNDSPSQYVPLGVCYAENASLLYAGVDVPCLMDTPNIEVDALDLRLIQSKGVGISNVSVVNYANGKLYLAITPSANVTAGSVYLLGLYGGKTIAFSCES